MLNCFITFFPPLKEAAASSVIDVIDFYYAMGIAFEKKKIQHDYFDATSLCYLKAREFPKLTSNT